MEREVYGDGGVVTIDEAYRRGQRDWATGTPYQDCPYRARDLATGWRKGWINKSMAKSLSSQVT